MRLTKAIPDMRTLCLTVSVAALLVGRVEANTLKVFPAAVELEGKDDRQSLVVQEVDGQGVTRDVTAAARLRLEDSALAAITGQPLAPRKDGTTRRAVAHNRLTA